jgi:hypothetical protein
MKLDQFISETLKSLIKGIKDAQDFAKQNGATINPEIENRELAKNANVIFFEDRDGAIGVSIVDFDIAVTASSEQGADLGAGINVLSLNIGGNKNEKQIEETISRIKFSVNVVLPSDPKGKAEPLK